MTVVLCRTHWAAEDLQRIAERVERRGDAGPFVPLPSRALQAAYEILPVVEEQHFPLLVNRARRTQDAEQEEARVVSDAAVADRVPAILSNNKRAALRRFVRVELGEALEGYGHVQNSKPKATTVLTYTDTTYFPPKKKTNWWVLQVPKMESQARTRPIEDLFVLCGSL